VGGGGGGGGVFGWLDAQHTQKREKKIVYCLGGKHWVLGERCGRAVGGGQSALKLKGEGIDTRKRLLTAALIQKKKSGDKSERASLLRSQGGSGGEGEGKRTATGESRRESWGGEKGGREDQKEGPNPPAVVNSSKIPNQ